MRRTLGFTRLELVLVLICFFGLMAVVLPAAKRELAFGRTAIARAQLEPIARAVRQMVATTRPKLRDGGYGILAGPRHGALPTNTASPQPLEWLGEPEAPTAWAAHFQAPWKGPYGSFGELDPWGRAFVVLPFGDPGMVCWCLSAGENGILETRPTDLSPAGDDIGIRVF